MSIIVRHGKKGKIADYRLIIDRNVRQTMNQLLSERARVHITSQWPSKQLPRDRPPIVSWKIPEQTEREWEKQRKNQTFSWTENYGLSVLEIIWREWRLVSHLELTSTQCFWPHRKNTCLASTLLQRIITVSCWRCCYLTLTSRSTRQSKFRDISLALWCWPVMLVTLP